MSSSFFSFPVLSDDAQYMVEFALAFVIFIFFIFFVIDLSLFIYNHNVLYHGTVNAVEVAANGATNAEIKNELHRTGIENYIPSPMSRVAIDTITLTPSEEMLRVRGKEAEVRLETTMGLLLMGVYPMTFDVDFSSRQLITQTNDADRDGCKDALEGAGNQCDSYRFFSDTFRDDHDNDDEIDIFRFDGLDDNADNDPSPSPQEDTVAIAYIDLINCTGYYIYRPNNPASRISPESCGTVAGISGTVWESWFDGWYHAPEVWDNNFLAQGLLFRRKLPKWSVTNHSNINWNVRILQTEHDRDNDGWIDKYDGVFNDPEQH